MADFRYPFPLQKYLFNRGRVSSGNYKPLIDDINFPEAAPPSGINAVLQGTLEGIVGQLVADVSGSVPLTYTTDFKGQNNGVGAAITSNTLTVSTGDFIAVIACYDDNTGSTAWTVSNTGTAITWTQRADTNTANNCRVVLWTGIAGATPPTTVTVTSTAGAATNATKSLATLVHSGQHATDPIPAGNIFTGANLTDASRTITPTATGSTLWMVAGDFVPTNSFAAIVNNTLVGTFNEAGRMTSTLIRPTTQPRPDAASFTLGETDTSGTIAYVAFEVRVAEFGTTLVLQGALGDISGQITTNTVTNATLQGSLEAISGTINASVAGIDASLQGSVGDLSGSLIANVSISATLQGNLDAISGQIVSSTATNATLQGTLGEISGSISANISTDAALQGSFEDISGSIVTGTEAVNVTLQGSFDGIVGQLQATILTSATLQGSFDGIFGQLQATADVGALLQGNIGDLSGALIANTSTNALLQGDLEGISGTITTSLLTPVDVVLTGSFDDISGFIDATVTDAPLEVIRVKGVGRKSNKKTLTYKDRKELDEKVFEVLFDLAKDVADKADISSSLVTSDVVSSIVNDVVNDVRASDISKIMLEESAKLQTDLILRNLRRKQRNREDEELMLLF